MPALPRPLHKFIADRDGNIAVVQAPNVPIIAWAATAILAKATHGTLHSVLFGVSRAALILWAILEITSGASPFRRVLGLIVLACSIITLL